MHTINFGTTYLSIRESKPDHAGNLISHYVELSGQTNELVSDNATPSRCLPPLQH